MSSQTHQGSIKPPAIAGRFYPAERDACIELVERCLADARPSPVPNPKILIIPHAAHIFSGPIAASAYAGLRALAGTITRVVLLGPAHRVGFKGIAVTSQDHWATPLGTVPVDWEGLRAALMVPGVNVVDGSFAEEHSLEVHLPFLQRVLEDFTLVPLLVGNADHNLVARVLDALWGGPETLVVISSDLSHFHDYETACRLDGETASKIELLQPEKIDSDGACGHRAIGGALRQARRRDLRTTALDVRNSGDTHGTKDRVVGYGSFALEYAETARLADGDRAALLNIARSSLKISSQHGEPPKASFGTGLSPTLKAMRACFVTLRQNGQLRGCIGSLSAHERLLENVITNTHKAGFGDPRFKPLALGELDELEIEVSILSAARQMSFTDEADLVRQLRPDQDGLILQDGNHRGLFLPSVWSGLPKAEQFVRGLKRKAGLDQDHWSDGLKMFRYTTETFSTSYRASD